MPSVLNGLWPCRDQGKLASCADAWRAAGQSLTDLKNQLHNALTALVDNNSGPDLVELESFWAEFTTGADAIFPAMDTAINAIASGLDDYDRMIDQFNDELRQAIIDAAIEAGLEELAVILVDLATDGAAAVFTGPEEEAIAARVTSHIMPVIERIVEALSVAQTIQNVTIDGETAVNAAIAAMPRPDLTTHEAWQTGDDVHPANNPTPRGSFNGDETAIASYLQGTGHVVVPIYEDHSTGNKNTDALVDGQPVDFKAVSGSGPRTIREALKKSESNGGQADEIFVDARGSALSNSQIQQQLEAYFTGGTPPKTKGVIKQVTVLMQDGTK